MEVAATLTITESPDGEITASWKTEKTNLEHLSKMREALLQIAEKINEQTHMISAKYGYDKGQEEMEEG